MKFLIPFLLLIMTSLAAARDLTPAFKSFIDETEVLSSRDMDFLKNVELIFVPGILAEALIQSDRSAPWDFTLITKDYFGEQLTHFEKLGLTVSRLPTSSASVKMTVANIQKALKRAKENDRKVIFITHSLGGLAMLDFLFGNGIDKSILGIAFLQSPFYGTGVASVYLNSPKVFVDWLNPILPFLNVSLETIDYLSLKTRKKIMKGYEKDLARLPKSLPVLTLGGSANGHASSFAPGLDLMEYGCFIATHGICLSPKVFKGPYDKSDGLVPLQSTFLPGVDSVVLPGVDHGEIIINVPFKDYDPSKLTEVSLKLLLLKIYRK